MAQIRKYLMANPPKFWQVGVWRPPYPYPGNQGSQVADGRGVWIMPGSG